VRQQACGLVAHCRGVGAPNVPALIACQTLGCRAQPCADCLHVNHPLPNTALC
jgi:hypothetical protein